ncbi:MAG: glycosyltransferase [Granulosicoccus sp.]
MNSSTKQTTAPPPKVREDTTVEGDNPSGASSPPRRIVHVLTRLLRAGAEENTLATCDYQIACGHEVYIVHGKDYDAEYVKTLNPLLQRIQVPEMVHPIAPWHDWKGLQALKKLYAKIQPDVVHTHQSKAGILGRLAALKANCTIIHTVHIAHWLSVGRLKQRLFVAIESYCSKRTHELISVSDGVRDACLAQGIGQADQHHVIHSGMNVNKFKQVDTAPKWQDYIENWHSNEKPFVILMMAAFEPRKRQEAFLRSMAPVLLRQPAMCVVFCGEGARLQSCQDLARELQIEQQVRFAGYIVSPEHYVALADVCVLSSEREGLPRVVIQYVAGRRPVVVNHLTGIEIIIQDGENGTIVTGDDIDANAAEIERLYLNPHIRESMSRAATSIDVSSWDVGRMGEQIQAVYDRAMSRVITDRQSG